LATATAKLAEASQAADESEWIRKAFENCTNMENDHVAVLKAQLSQAKLSAEEAVKKCCRHCQKCYHLATVTVTLEDGGAGEVRRTLNLVLIPTTTPLNVIVLPRKGPEPRDSLFCGSKPFLTTWAWVQNPFLRWETCRADYATSNDRVMMSI
jgi:hypothetical protein